MRLATIDLGSNTVRLLVADVDGPGSWRVLDRDQRVTRLGEGLASSGLLAPAAMSRTAATVAEYVGRAAGWAADDVRIVATSAVREAGNGRRFAADLERATGRPVQIVSGDDEARLTLRGILHGLGRLTGAVVTFDIGGGSTEYIRARDGVLVAAVSLRLGVVPLAERFPFPRAVDRDRYRRLEAEVAERLDRELPPAVVDGPVDRLVGTAGTVTTLAALDLELPSYEPSRVQGHVLDRERIERLRARLGALSVTARAALPCLEPGRADLILPGIAIVTATLHRFGVERLVVSDDGLREGILADAIDARP
jgi:exopolyphosphatase/guanosine-5'-triphosphate,3'-diphosphate pyrophosphatase